MTKHYGQTSTLRKILKYIIKYLKIKAILSFIGLLPLLPAAKMYSFSDKHDYLSQPISLVSMGP